MTSPYQLTAEDHLYRGSQPTRIYAIRCTDTGIVKIGHSKDPARRLRHLQTGSPTRLEIILDEAATLWHEAVLHERYAARRKHGEWFSLTERQVDEIIAWKPEPVPTSLPPRSAIIDGELHERMPDGRVAVHVKVDPKWRSRR